MMSVLQHAPFGGMQFSFLSLLSPRAMLPCSSTSGCRFTFPSRMIITKSHRIQKKATERRNAVAAGHATNKGQVAKSCVSARSLFRGSAGRWEKQCFSRPKISVFQVCWGSRTQSQGKPKYSKNYISKP